MTILLSPFAPHISEELWKELGHKPGIMSAEWPGFDPAALARDEIELAIQVNGKVRGRITVPAGTPEDIIREQALADESTRKFIQGKQVRKVIVVPGKLVNIAAS